MVKSRKGCQYHLCEYKGKDVYECPHCHKNYCETHKNPKIASMPNFKRGSDENEEALKNYRLENAHPCPDYYEVYIKEKKEAEQQYLESLNKALKKREDKPSEIKSRILFNTKKSRNLLNLFIIIFVLILIAIFYYWATLQ